MQPIRTLVLSGGGGRGAFHAGVYKYLMETGKTGLTTTHAGAWQPDIVVGTSIGAVNGAAIIQGISPRRLEHIWLNLREHHIQGLPPGMKGISQWIARRVLKGMIGVNLPSVAPEQATSPIPDEFWPPMPLLPRWMANRLIGHWINLLDTGPLRQTLLDEFKIDEVKLSQRQKTLLITATNVQTGERVIFSNQAVYSRDTDQQRTDVHEGVTINRILASCSIPLVYPWTYDAETQAYYWDGAIVANTPLGAALDVVREVPVEVPMEVVVVLMTPWWRAGELPPTRAQTLPNSFDDALTWSLDWALLSSFRERLRLVRAYNKFAAQERAAGREQLRYRQVDVIIISPDDFFPVARIIDYDEKSKQLIAFGYAAAQKAFHERFQE